MIRILQVVNIMNRAGLENMLMNYYRNIDKSKIQFDFLTHRPEQGVYDDEIEKLGGRVYHAPRLYPQNYVSYFKYMKHFFEEHNEYKIIHSHIDTMSAFPLLAAKINGIPIRIAHSHTSKLDIDEKLPIKYIAKKIVPIVSNQYFACGDKAGKFLFGNKEFKIVRNAIDLNRFKFNPEIRNIKRNNLGIENKLVIGHVGRYCYIKNQKYLIDIFKEVLKETNNAVLLLIGTGEEEQELRDIVKNNDLSNSVVFLTNRDDVNELYQAMDIFIMPSLFEGVPVVGVEAQANGLCCIFSDKISKEILLTRNCKSISLDCGKKVWAKLLIESDKERNKQACDELCSKGYDVSISSLKLAECYEKMNNDNKGDLL